MYSNRENEKYKIIAGVSAPHEPAIKTGYLARYRVLATIADTGGVLRW
jgi:hypothetical protein